MAMQKNTLKTKQTYTDVIAHLQDEASKVLNALIPNNAHIILIDYPNNPNIGDSLIWMGEIAYLKSRNLKPSYVCDIKNYDAVAIKKIIGKSSIILMHGGGNFGTVWPEEHAFRLKVLHDFPQVKIIQFPQTIYFDNEVEIAAMRQAIADQGDFVLLARSQKCYEFAKQNFSARTYLCPDMAFFIGPVKQLNPMFDRFILARTDHEKSADLMIESSCNSLEQLTYQNSDWLEASWQERLLHRVEMHTVFLRKIIDPNNLLLLFIWNLLSALRLKRGVKLLSKGRVVITDRLHAHILSILMNKPHVVIDNIYGKISNYYHSWTLNYIAATYVSDVKKLHIAAYELDAIYGNKVLTHYEK